LPDAADVVGFRPRRAQLSDNGHIRGEISLVERLGDTGYVHIRIEDEDEPIVVTARSFDFDEGDNVGVDLDMEHLLYFDAAGNRMKSAEREARMK
jgi:ABC-type sugar transport system ATPase subunit